jgi:hypothetical protein
MNVISKLASLLDGAPEAAAKPLRSPSRSPVIVTPSDGAPSETSSGNLAPMINATVRGDPRSPMDHVKIIPRRPPDLEHVPFPTLEQERIFQSAVTARGFAVSSSTVRALEALEQPWRRLSTALGTYADSAARVEHQKHIASTTKKIAAGEDSIEADEMWTLDQWKEDFFLRRAAIKAEMKVLEQEAAKLVLPIKLQYSEALLALADELEAPLVEQAGKFACPHHPTPVILMVRKASQVAADASRTPTGRPKLMLGNLTLTIS